MDRQQLAHFVSHYQHMNEDALFELYGKSDDLTEEAREALNGVIAGRNIDIAQMIIDRDSDEKAYAAKIKQKEIRNAKWIKIYMMVAIPICIVAALFHPDKALQTFVSTLTQLVIIALLYWLFLFIKRIFKGKVDKQTGI